MAQAKYVFYFIGDGMGTNQVLAAEMYQVATFSASYGITDSAAAVPIFAIGVGAKRFIG